MYPDGHAYLNGIQVTVHNIAGQTQSGLFIQLYYGYAIGHFQTRKPRLVINSKTDDASGSRQCLYRQRPGAALRADGHGRVYKVLALVAAQHMQVAVFATAPEVAILLIYLWQDTFELGSVHDQFPVTTLGGQAPCIAQGSDTGKGRVQLC